MSYMGASWAGLIGTAHAAPLPFSPSIRTRGRARLLAAFGLPLGLLVASTVPANAGVQRLTSDLRDNGGPQINRTGEVVWSTDSNVYLWDGSVTRQLNQDRQQSGGGAQINDARQVTWTGGGRIYLWDGSTIRQISNRLTWITVLPRINRAGQVVWRGVDSPTSWYNPDGTPGQIYLWTGTSLQQLTDSPTLKTDPYINAQGQVVWLEKDPDGNHPHIQLWDHGGTRSISPTTWSNEPPQINDGGQVYWHGHITTDGLFLWDGSTIRSVSDPTSWVRGDVRVNAAGPVAWMGPGGVYLWKGSRLQSVYIDPGPISDELQVNSAGQMVWRANNQVFFWDGLTTQNLTPDSTGAEPQINDAGRVVWTGWDGSHTQIYMYTPPVPGSVDFLTETPVYDGQKTTGVVTLTSPAPPGGALVHLSADSPVATVPDRITIPAGATSAHFPVTISLTLASTSVTVSASYHGITWTSALPVIHVAVRSLEGFATYDYAGGSLVRGIVKLDHAAPPGGAVVSLASDNPEVLSVPKSVEVKPGTTEVDFVGMTHFVKVRTPVRLSASYGGVTRSATLAVAAEPPLLADLHTNATTIVGGNTVAGEVALDAAALPGGARITLSSDRPDVVGASPVITVPEGRDSMSFQVSTHAVKAVTTVHVSASYNGSTRTAALQVLPAGLASLSLQPNPIMWGRHSSATITLDGPAPEGGLVVSLFSADPAAAAVPASVTVAAGATTATFAIPAGRVRHEEAISISASAGGASRTAQLLLLPAGIGALTLEPGSFRGGRRIQGRVTLQYPAPAGGAVITLESSNPTAASVPATITVPAGARVATFILMTHPIRTRTTVTFQATYAGVTQTAALSLRR